MAPPPRSSGSRVEGAAASDERAGPERRVELVPGEREVVDADAAMSMARWGASWAASTKSRRRSRCATRGELGSGQTSPVTFEAPVTATRSIRGRAVRSACSQRSTELVEPLLGTGSTARRGGATAACWRGARPAVLSTRAPGRQRRGQDVDRLGRVAHEHDACRRAPRRTRPPPRARPRRRRSRAATCSRCRGARCCTTAGSPARRGEHAGHRLGVLAA